MIEQDHQRFRQIVKGRIRDDLRKFLTKGELLGREGKRYVSIPVHDIDIPTFRYGDNSGGVGMGEGEAAVVRDGAEQIDVVAREESLALHAAVRSILSHNLAPNNPGG